MDKATRNAIERATQQARNLLDEDFSSQLEGTFDVLRSGVIASNGGAHLSARQMFHRDKIVATIAHKCAAGNTAVEAITDYVRDSAFTTLNRFVALKMLEARELVQECITKGEQSSGYREFCGMAPGLGLLPEAAGYRLYIESLFDEFSTEIKALFDRSDAASVLWPKRQTFEALLAILNAPELSGVWDQDETIGWVYQFFNGGDERRAMREASQVPRNGRELAVRNQFFTPRYVVQFLTDNTLGRVWCEMRSGQTALHDQCEYLVSRPGEVYTPRNKKDPRDLHLLDPACGSGHFLLYAFDLLSTIYEEAYGDTSSPKSEATGRTLVADYPSIDVLRRALPAMILAHNLHGVDIDPRCAQIAQLALWMRAQRTYRDFGIPREERPLIRRSNIVVAEPLVTDDGVLEEFLAKLGDTELVRVFTDLIDSLKLAGDLGLLLRVEEQIAREPKRGETRELFAPPEARIREALLHFVVASNISGRTRRRLFADDAAQGVGLLEIAEKKFDVVLMNPPFGAATVKSTTHECLNNASGGDLYSAFVARGLELLNPVGRLGAITPRSFIYQLDFIDYRRDWLIPNAQLPLLVELGFGELDEASNRTAAYVLGRKSDTIEPTLYSNVGAAPDKRERLVALTRGDEPWTVATLVDAADPYTSALLFRMTPALRTKLAEYRRLDPVLGKSHRGSRNGVVQLVNGLQCPEDFRYVRLQVEVRPADIGHRWVPFLKPIGFTPYVGEVACVVNWKERGAEQKAAFVGAGVSPSKYVSGEGFYPALGVWFPDVSERGIAASLIPYPAIPGRKGLLAALPEDASFSAEALTGFMNSIWAEGLLGLITPERHHKPSYVGQIPWIPAVATIAESHNRRIVDLASREAPTELSPFFALPDVVRYKRSTIAETADWLQRHWFATREEIVRQIAEFDDVILRAVGASDDDVALLREMSQRGPVESWFPSEHDLNVPLLPQVAADLVSFAMGTCLGRHQGMEATESTLRVQKRDSMPIQPSTTEGTNLVDDAGHRLDIMAAVMRTLTKYWADGEAILDELGRTLSPEDGDLRSWISRKFFSFHVARYTKSRRAAPIYWQLATSSASYSVWLYLHGFTKDTLYKIQNDYVAPKVGHEERKLESLRGELGESPKAAERKALDAQEKFVDELRSFLEEVKRVAPLWNPSLDDGVVINFSPLWRLVPHQKPWQKELKATWDGLCAGDYDWAHLAMHLWPERVVPKCATDRSLAIAHGLEEVFWLEGDDGKWKPRSAPTRSVTELVRERTSSAVQAALKNLLEAPVASAAASRGRGRRATTAAADGGAR